MSCRVNRTRRRYVTPPRTRKDDKRSVAPDQPPGTGFSDRLLLSCPPTEDEAKLPLASSGNDARPSCCSMLETQICCEGKPKIKGTRAHTPDCIHTNAASALSAAAAARDQTRQGIVAVELDVPKQEPGQKRIVKTGGAWPHGLRPP